MNKKRKTRAKVCQRCLGQFRTYKNFDYCGNCAAGNRYLVRSNLTKNMRIIKSKKNPKIYDGDKNLTFWEQVDKETHCLLADILNRKLPLANCRDKKIFNPQDDSDYRTLCTDYENDYGPDLPKLEKASEEIAYEYLFLVVKSLIGELKRFAVHKEEYLQKLF
ncbi:MAG: hypothetical protein MRERV_32c016 [Mycoplasmataceae bacterium RV_VA103A]|nr:MAG: hypothetical protein MRERV_32c016 [Mycoplasmataceae bacterium RV_VA103A]